MSKGAGLDHEYERFEAAVHELQQAEAQCPSDPAGFCSSFQDTYRGLLTSGAWSKTATGVDGLTFNQLVRRVNEKLGQAA